jgi:hypothetical protein
MKYGQAFMVETIVGGGDSGMQRNGQNRYSAAFKAKEAREGMVESTHPRLSIALETAPGDEEFFSPLLTTCRNQT